ncbi:MAG: MlaA family lipoprotein [Desulfuromonadaceae bacterium]
MRKNKFRHVLFWRKIVFLGAVVLALVFFSAVYAGAGENPSVPETAAPKTQMRDAGSAYEDSSADDLFSDDLYGEGAWDEEWSDPLEPVNRAVFWLNDKGYFYILKPAARVFRVVPTPLRSGISRMFDNIKSPLRAISSLLQLKFSQSLVELSRLVINTTIGVAGFYDPAKNWWDLRKQEEDLGQVLGHYGVGNGFYLVLPVLGPSTLRDGVALVPQYYTDPLYWTLHRDGQLVAKGIDVVNAISLDKDTYESIVAEQLDPYLFIRDAYLQRRAAQVNE